MIGSAEIPGTGNTGGAAAAPETFSFPRCDFSSDHLSRYIDFVLGHVNIDATHFFFKALNGFMRALLLDNRIMKERATLQLVN